MICSLHTRFGAAVSLALFVAAAPMAEAGALRESFNALPIETRIAIQTELRNAKIYLADPDGHWNDTTERALLRSVDTIALKTNDMVHPKLNSRQAMMRYYGDLIEGTYSTVLYGGRSFVDTVYFLSVAAPPTP